MRATLPLCICAAVALTGCARIQDSRLNPFNWFASGPSVAAPVDADGNLRPLVPAEAKVAATDNRTLIDQIANVSANRTPDGVILTATGIAAVQGQFNAQLVPASFENGVLTLAYRVSTPQGAAASGSDGSRRITAARVLNNADLQGVRRITVEGARNARTVRP